MDQILEGLRKKPKPLKQEELEIKFKTPYKEGELREIDDETLNEMLEGKTVDEIDAEKEKEEIIIEDAREENIDTDFNDFLSTLPNKVTNVKQGTTKRKITEIQEKPKEKSKALPKEKSEKKTDTKVIIPKRERISQRKDITKPSKHEVFSISLDEDIEEKLPKKEDLILLKKSSYYLNNREVFVTFIDKLFKEYRQEVLEDKSQLSCDSSEQSEEFKLLTHQKIVREYINLYSPYRGLLIYHGLGSGKTCSSIAIAETFQQLHSVALAEGTVNIRKVVVMTPASLRTNFFEELKKCGDPLHRKNQYWEFVLTNGDEELASWT